MRISKIVVGAVALLAACGRGAPQGSVGGSEQEQPAAGQAAVTVGSVEVRLEVPRTVAAGRPVPMRIVVRNISDRPVTFDVMEPQTVDFLVTTADGRFVWDLLVGETCPDKPVITLVGDPVISPPMRPGEARTYQHVWAQRDQCGRPASPGEYRVEGVLYASAPHRTIELGPLPLTITP